VSVSAVDGDCVHIGLFNFGTQTLVDMFLSFMECQAPAVCAVKVRGKYNEF
jgi:hypothetical protein